MKSGTNRSKRRRTAAFTLMEMLLVFALMGVLMGVLAMGFGGVFESNSKQAALMFCKQTSRASFMRYRMDMGSYPSSDEGMKALLNAPEGEKSSRWKGPYADELPKDPWGNDYRYANPGTHNKSGYDLWSMGPDGQDGTADDVGNWAEADAK